MMDQSLHGGLHLSSGGRDALRIVGPHVSLRHLIETLLYDTETLPHLGHSHQISVIAVSIAAHRNIKINEVVGVIWLGLPQVVLDSWTVWLQERKGSGGPDLYSST